MKYLAPHIKNKLNAGFTLIELMVSIGIMILVMALILVNYGKFDTGIILTNLAYDIGLSVRKAQSYGISVKGVTVGSTQNFNSSYGIHFDVAAPKNYILFADTLPSGNPNGVYSCPNPNAPASCEKVEGFTLGGAYSIVGLYQLVNGTKSAITSVDITFTRPNPDATVHVNGTSGTPTDPIEIDIASNEDPTSIKSIIVRSTGQISIQ
jgi:type II secretory pathway pseudopilin PulG